MRCEVYDCPAGSVTPRSKSPASTSVTPFREEELVDLLRASPSIDFSRLNIKQESVSQFLHELAGTLH